MHDSDVDPAHYTYIRRRRAYSAEHAHGRTFLESCFSGSLAGFEAAGAAAGSGAASSSASASAQQIQSMCYVKQEQALTDALRGMS